MKTRIDVERLLHWALCEELPKGKPVALDVRELVCGHAKPGEGRGFWQGESDALGVVPGETHADAQMVNAAIRALPPGIMPRDLITADDLLGPYAALDPLAVDAVMRAPFHPADLVIRGAVLGRPQWDVGQPRPQRRMQHYRDSVGRLREKPLVYGTEPDGALVIAKANRKTGLYAMALQPHSPLDWGTPPVGRMVEARADYLIWHRALCLLARDLRTKLSQFLTDDPSAPVRPWQGEVDTKSRVLPTLRKAAPMAHKSGLAPLAAAGL